MFRIFTDDFFAPSMTRDEIVQFWVNSSDQDFRTMNNLWVSGDYHWSLFIGHLVIEKLLKAYYVRNLDEDYPLIHNLLRIAEKAGIGLTEEQQIQLATITNFNINGRYDDYKQSFFKTCTKEYATEWIEKISLIRNWLKAKL